MLDSGNLSGTGGAKGLNEDAGRESGYALDDADVLRALVLGTASATGGEFFQGLVRHLAAATATRYAFVAEFLPPQRARTLAFWFRDRIADDVEWDLPGTPCEDVIRGELCHHPRGVKDLFPQDEPMVELGIESYLGVPLRDTAGNTLGHLAVFDDRPMPAEPRRLQAFRIFAARAAAELERLRAESELRDRERRYRDLYEEAPIAYKDVDRVVNVVHEVGIARKVVRLRPLGVVKG